MNVALLNVDSEYPNLALMKISANTELLAFATIAVKQQVMGITSQF